MQKSARTICWVPLWNYTDAGTCGYGLEHLLLRDGQADSVILALDEARQPFRLAYTLNWDDAWRLHEADLHVTTEQYCRTLRLRSVGEGHWRDGEGKPLTHLDGCIDIDIWPTPFTNTFPIRREPMTIGDRRDVRVAWVRAPELTVTATPQAYTRIGERRYRFESLDGSGFQIDLAVDEQGLVLDYPELFRRLI